MGWGSGTNAQGREVGYLVMATCDEKDCEAQIDRGMAYVCGGMHDGGTHGCGGYFCSKHLAHAFRGEPEEMSPQLCARCLTEWESAGEAVAAEVA